MFQSFLTYIIIITSEIINSNNIYQYNKILCFNIYAQICDNGIIINKLVKINKKAISITGN